MPCHPRVKVAVFEEHELTAATFFYGWLKEKGGSVRGTGREISANA